MFFEFLLWKNCIVALFTTAFSVSMWKKLNFDYFWKNDHRLCLCLKISWPKFESFLKSVFWLFFWKKIYCDIIHNRLLSVYVKKELIFDYFWENDGHMSVPQNFLTKVWNFENFIKSVFWLFFWKKFIVA